MAEPDVLAELPPLHRARAFLLLAKSASALLSVRLRCSGIRPDDHPIGTEFRPKQFSEQRQSMREISKGEGVRRFTDTGRDQKKRKYQSVEKQSVRDATQEFLQKAARELLGSSNCGVKGPLRAEISNQEDEPTN